MCGCFCGDLYGYLCGYLCGCLCGEHAQHREHTRDDYLCGYVCCWKRDVQVDAVSAGWVLSAGRI